MFGQLPRMPFDLIFPIVDEDPGKRKSTVTYELYDGAKLVLKDLCLSMQQSPIKEKTLSNLAAPKEFSHISNDSKLLSENSKNDYSFRPYYKKRTNRKTKKNETDKKTIVLLGTLIDLDDNYCAPNNLAVSPIQGDLMDLNVEIVTDKYNALKFNDNVEAETLFDNQVKK
ncbi:unnamed protein product [Brachionus calyciflorus]|uniref:Uncharacterized protein n=1 Tax=Brachionus calyciflorus TaxID=104777 RepID=A0A813TH41_9BILA|nr:unnamed protein product [Brachionus calyciflorus]